MVFVLQNDIKLKISSNVPNVANYLYLAKIVANRFRNRNSFEKIEDTEEFSIACEELVHAASLWDSQTYPNFKTYAFRCMINGVIENIRYKKCKCRNTIHQNLSEKDWENIDSDKRIISVDNELVQSVLADDSRDTEQDREDKSLLVEVYLKQKKISTIADQLGLSRVSIYDRIKRIIGKLKERHKNSV